MIRFYSLYLTETIYVIFVFNSQLFVKTFGLKKICDAFNEIVILQFRKCT